MFKQYYMPIFISLASKIIILVSIPILTTYIFRTYKLISIWETWNVWDARHYIDIATSNYHVATNDEEVLIGFLPFLPLMIYLTKTILNFNFLISGYIVSAVSTSLLAIILYKLVLLDYSKKIALYALLFLFIFPTSFFLHIPFTESLFILLSVAAFYFVRKKHYLMTFLCIGAATFTKIAGLSLVPAIFIELLLFHKETFKKTIQKWSFFILGLFVSVSGLCIFLYINYLVWGNPFYFTVVQKKYIHETFAPFGQGLINALTISFNNGGLNRWMLGYAQVLAFLFGLAMSIYTLIKIRLSYGIYMVFVLWFSYSLSFWLSMPRHILPLFPMFIILALFSKNLLFRYIWILISSFLLIMFAMLFIQWESVM